MTCKKITLLNSVQFNLLCVLIRCIKYWFLLLIIEHGRLPKHSFQMLLLMDENEKKCWASDIKNILVELKMSNPSWLCLDSNYSTSSFKNGRPQ